MRRPGRALACLLACILLLPPGRAAQSGPSPDAAIAETARFLCRTVPHPQVGSIGGEWAVLGLARSGCPVPEGYFEQYYATVEAYVRSCSGNLHDKKYTEYSRLILALTAIGKDPRAVAGYDLTLPLGDYEKTIWQGLNGPIWALIALDSGGYPVPLNAGAKIQATRPMYVQRILDCQLPDGGWSLFGGTAAEAAGDGSSDPDITGMALQALSAYEDQPAVQGATEKALACLSRQQNGDGGYSSWATDNSESVVQVLVALCALGISPEDARFVKNGRTTADHLMSYYLPDKGFRHTGDGSGSSQMATEQGLYGLVAAQRLREGRPPLYRMSDPLHLPDGPAAAPVKGMGLPAKSAAVTARPIVSPGKTFADMSGHKNQPAIEALAARGILSGKSGGLFDPEGEMTRAEFSALAVRALGLTPEAEGFFSDVAPSDWYAPFAGTAHRYGIVEGTDGARFQPHGTITRQEAAVMLARAGSLCGMAPAPQAAAARDVLAKYPDYVQAAPWARPALAFCCTEELLDGSAALLQPRAVLSRGKIAQMFFLLLGRANLL